MYNQAPFSLTCPAVTSLHSPAAASAYEFKSALEFSSQLLLKPGRFSSQPIAYFASSCMVLARKSIEIL